MFNKFSKKQMQVLSWWVPGSGYEKMDAIICDGAVRSGKTLCESISFFAWASVNFDDRSFALCGKTISSLRRNIITPVTPILLSLGFEIKENLTANLLTVTFKNHTNRFYIFGGKDEGSASLIQGMTLAGVMFDEVALMVRSFVEQALARCSVEGSKFFFNCNPDFPKHWFKTEWIEKAEERNALYIHFTMHDNPSLSKRMIERYERLYAGPFYDRFVLGKWVGNEGMVYPMFSPERHIVPAPDYCEEYAVSCDYGTVNPASFGLWGRVDDKWVRIREYYFDARREGYRKTDSEHFEGLRELIGDLPVSKIVIDPSAASFIETVERAMPGKVIRAKNDVIDGIRLVSSALKEEKILFTKGCSDTIREFGLYRWKENTGKEEVVKENDHAMDDVRYFVTSILTQKESVFECFAVERE